MAVANAQQYSIHGTQNVRIVRVSQTFLPAQVIRLAFDLGPKSGEILAAPPCSKQRSEADSIVPLVVRSSNF
jgi:hypothetical protein